MDGVEVLRLGKLSDVELILACTLLGKHSLLNVGLCVPDALSEKFGELCSMLGLLEGIPLEGIGNLRITFPVGLAAHRNIHSHFGALACEMSAKPLKNLRINSLCNSKFVLASPRHHSFLFLHFNELV